jgi:hypothetical protein
VILTVVTGRSAVKLAEVPRRAADVTEKNFWLGGVPILGARMRPSMGFADEPCSAIPRTIIDATPSLELLPGGGSRNAEP